MNVFEALDRLWNSFGWPAYDDNTTPAYPDTPALPYITYSVVTSNFDEPFALTASLWGSGTSWAVVDAKALEINSYIGPGGITIPIDGGVLWIKRGSPAIQRMPDPDKTIRRIYMVFEAEAITNT